MDLVNVCPNCGAERTTEFCGHCGQNSRDFNQSFWHVIGEALGELFELDGRVARSLKTIFLRPGQLAIEFEANRRASFVNPIRALLFTSFIWFIAFSVTLQQGPPIPAQRALGIEDRNIDTEVEPDDIEIEEVSEGIRIVRESLRPSQRNQFDLLMSQEDEKPKTWFLRASLIFQNEPDLPHWFTEVIAQVAYDLTYSPSSLKDALIDNFPIMMFFLLPWYSGLLMLFYGRGGKRLMHHLVFAFHVHIFAFMLFTIIILTPEGRGRPEWGNWQWWHHMFEIVDYLLIAGFYVHTFLSFKRYYKDGIAKTLAKFFSLHLFYAIGLLPAFVLVLVMTILEYL